MLSVERDLSGDEEGRRRERWGRQKKKKKSHKKDEEERRPTMDGMKRSENMRGEQRDKRDFREQ